MLKSLHRTTAVLIALFAAIHIANHLVAVAGVPVHLEFMKAARGIYRTSVVEWLLLIAVAAQVVSGLVLVITGWRLRRGFVAWLQAACGAYLVFFLLVHVGAVLYGRAVMGLDTNFYFAAAGMHVGSLAWFFVPYYFLAVVALFTHLGCALYWRASGPRRRLALIVPATIGCAASLVIVLCLSGVLIPVTVPDAYKATYGGGTGLHG